MIKSVEQIALVLVCLAVGSANAQQSLAKTSGAEEAKETSAQPHDYNASALRRLDFRVVGKNCALCLHRMQERIRELPGIVKVGVMQKKPYGAVVIYDSSKVKTDKIFDKAKEGIPEVTFEDKSDAAIKAIPLVLVPKAAAEGEDAVRTKVDP